MARRKKALPPREIKARTDDQIARDRAHVDAALQRQVEGLQQCQDDLVTARTELYAVVNRVDRTMDRLWDDVLRLLWRSRRGQG